MMGPNTRKTLAVVALSILVITAVPAATANTDGQLVAGSQNTTDSDFENAQVLDNFTVSGSGDSASAGLDVGTEVESGFETASEWSVTDDVGGSSGITTQNPRTGTYSLAASHDTGGTDGNDLYATHETGDAHFGNVSYYYHPENSDYWNTGGVFREQADGDAIAVYFDVVAGVGEIRIEERVGGTWTTLGTTSADVSLTAGGWNEVEIELREGSSGVYGVGVVAGQTFTTPEVNTAVTSTGSFGVGQFRPENTGQNNFWDDVNMTLEKQTESAQYVSSIHSVSDPEEAAINIPQLYNVEADATVRTNGGTTLATSTITSTGNHSLSLTDTSASQIEVVLDVTVTGDDPQFELSDESILFTNQAPDIDNATATPSGGTTVTHSPIELSIDVSDKQFGTAQGEQVTVTFYDASDDSEIGTDTLSSGNGTATAEWSSLSGGDSSWYAVAEDSYGGVQQSDTFMFTAPGELQVYDEQRFPELVNDTQVNATIYSGDDTYFRETTNGAIDLTGLPPGEQLTVEVEADGYADRTVIIDSLFDQQSVFMLADSTDSVDIAFQVDDSTGSFSGSDIELLVQRPIVQNGNTEWRTVIGNGIGANNKLPVTLEQDGSYRLVVRSEDESRILGKYKASQSVNPEVLPIGTVDISTTVTDGTAFGASLDTIRDSDGNVTDRLVRMTYFDNVDATDAITYRVVRTDTMNETVIIANTTETNPEQHFTMSTPINASLPDGASYRVEYWTERTGHPDVSGERPIGNVDEIADRWGIDGRVMTWLAYTFLVGFAGLSVVRSPKLASMGTVVLATAMTIIGVISIPGVLLGMAGAVALLFNLGGIR